mgnify:CR=1 FL=1
MPKIAIVDKIHSDGIKLLEDNTKFQYEIIEDLSKKNLISKLPSFDGITLRRGKIDAEILEKCKNLKVISRHGVGYDNVDTKFLKENGAAEVFISNIDPNPDISGKGIKELNRLNIKTHLGILKNEGNELKSEFLIPTVVNELIRSGKEGVHVLRSGASWFGITYKEDRPFVTGEIQKLVDEGVYPSPLF